MASRTDRLGRTLGFRDLTLFYIATTFGLRWVATAAAVGPRALFLWLAAAAGLFIPLAFTVVELSSRYPEEGGIYAWSKHAFGPFAAFITGWTYWCSNLPYFPSLLYVAAANALFIGGPEWRSWSARPSYFMIVSAAGLGIAMLLNIVGLAVGKWLTNAGALAGWLAVMLLVIFGAASWARYGMAQPMGAHDWLRGGNLKDAMFWATMAFAFAGVESGSIMAEEIRDARRTIPRAVIVAGLVLVFLYVAGTFSILVAMPGAEVSGLQGIMQAIDVMTRHIGVAWLVAPAAILVTLNALGCVGGWFAATARLPFVAGIDHFLPQAFANLHPRWNTPYVALLTQAAICLLVAIVGQAGTSVRGAYDVLVSMSVVAAFIPFLFMFTAMIKVQQTQAPPEAMRVPGGRPVAVALAALGLATTTASIIFACIPPVDEPNKPLAVLKIVGASVALVAIGTAVYASQPSHRRS